MPKILVVDDQRNMRTTLAMMLRGGGYEVDEAATAPGRRLGARGAYDVVITDLRMGGDRRHRRAARRQGERTR
jgi:two-component system response regulator HydG